MIPAQEERIISFVSEPMIPVDTIVKEFLDRSRI